MREPRDTKPTDPHYYAVLSAPMPARCATSINVNPSVRGYLASLLEALWLDGPNFSGKRPFGQSGWKWDVYEALVTAGLVDGRFDADGCLATVDADTADRLIHNAIHAMAGFAHLYATDAGHFCQHHCPQRERTGT
jgi:hypothetical protein